MRREPATVWDSRGVAIIGWRSGDGGMKRGVELEGALPPGASATGEPLVAVGKAPARALAVATSAVVIASSTFGTSRGTVIGAIICRSVSRCRPGSSDNWIAVLSPE
jgi:hypothetical protein